MKENKKSKVMIMVLSSTFIIGAIPSVSFAESKYQTQIDSIEKKRSEVKEKTEATKDKIDDLQQDQANVVKKLEQLDVKMKETKRQVNQTQDAVESGKKEISKLKEEIKFIEKRIESRQELLKDRMRSLQKSGGMLSYIDVILGSNSFGDLIQRMSAVQVIMEADEDIINQQNLDLKIVNSKKDEMTVKQAKIERDLANLETLNKQLSNQVNEQNNLMASLKEQEKEAHEDVLNLKEQDELLASQQIALKKAAEEAKRKAAEEARLKAEREKEKNDNKPSNGGSGNSGNSGNSGGGSTPPISSGNFTRPAAGYISSGFGNRSFDGGGFHDGVDIAGSGTVPVVSAGDGVVIRAYTSSSYGNCVFITHNIGGQVWTTVYAHLDSFNVSTGQSVSKGTKIGFMGNTGHSFGQHLHFELHKGEWNASKSNAVDPQKYINF
ncbi:murein hydrolase activator EnvC family protein [Gottfriedia solisilvae]|uniref:Peptidase M24 n=1 Tax=Gottfriedia solisilvae TaxID=1516104 RepID=A0A8J3ATV8_9BACI|nr:M23 family metallopeptidase [Gottfriedia solisilvae]GGI16481.1 peptidase M24 [Gottfriedia solisilvae]